MTGRLNSEKRCAGRMPIRSALACTTRSGVMPNRLATDSSCPRVPPVARQCLRRRQSRVPTSQQQGLAGCTRVGFRGCEAKPMARPSCCSQSRVGMREGGARDKRAYRVIPQGPVCAADIDDDLPPLPLEQLVPHCVHRACACLASSQGGIRSGFKLYKVHGLRPYNLGFMG
jgi:hypothetical protein